MFWAEQTVCGYVSDHREDGVLVSALLRAHVRWWGTQWGVEPGPNSPSLAGAGGGQGRREGKGRRRSGAWAGALLGPGAQLTSLGCG